MFGHYPPMDISGIPVHVFVYVSSSVHGRSFVRQHSTLVQVPSFFTWHISEQLRAHVITLAPAVLVGLATMAIPNIVRQPISVTANRLIRVESMAIG